MIIPGLQWLAYVFRALGERQWASAPVQIIHGLHTRVHSHDGDPTAAFQAVKAACGLIGEVDPRRLRRMKQDLGRVVVCSLRPGLAMYVPATRTCYLRVTAVVGRPTVAVAILLVHEATHARLHHAGVRQWGSRRVRRVEQRCMREELAFADRLPPAAKDGLAEWAAGRRRRLAGGMTPVSN